MGINLWGDVHRTERDIGIELWGEVNRMDSCSKIDLRGDANRTGHDIRIIKDVHRHLHNPNILASTFQIIKNHNYGNKPLFFYLVQLTGGSHPSGGHLLVLDGHNPNILASTFQIIKNHNYGNKPLFFYLVQLTGGSHPSGGHLLVLDGGHHLARGILLLNGDYLLKLSLEPRIGGH